MARYSTEQYSTEQYSTEQYSTEQYSTVQNNTKRVLMSLLNSSLDCMALFACSVITPNKLPVCEN